MSLTLVFLFLAGIANFAMHRALLDSPDPLIRAATAPVRRPWGRQTSYLAEFALLLIALWQGTVRPLTALLLYGVYTMVNALVFALVTRRPR